jgi:hypothetical protein
MNRRATIVFFSLVLASAGFILQDGTSVETADTGTTVAYEMLVLSRLDDNHRALLKIALSADGQPLATETVIASQPSLRLADRITSTYYFTDLDGSRYAVDRTTGQVSEFKAPDSNDVGWRDAILAQTQPLSGPRDFIPVPSAQEAVIFTMTGAQDNYANLYLLDADDAIQQLTFAETVAPEGSVVLSASTSFIAWRPAYETQFLYRARARTGDGTDWNRLFLYDEKTQTSAPMPYFGQDPVWSPDGNRLIGGRLDSTLDPPRYMLSIAELESGTTTTVQAGCNPQLSPDGRWLAMDVHTDSQWQGYTDCFADGDVVLHNLETGVIVEVTRGISEFTHVVGWLERR